MNNILNQQTLEILLKNLLDRIYYYQILQTTTLDNEYINLLNTMINDNQADYNMLLAYYEKTIGNLPTNITPTDPHIDSFTSGVAHAIIYVLNDYKNFRDIYSIYNNNEIKSISFILLTDANIHAHILNYLYTGADIRSHDLIHQDMFY